MMTFSKIILYSNEFEHFKDISIYNRNFYKHKSYGYIILEVCHEYLDFYSFYLIEDSKEVFIGCGNSGIGMGSERTEIDFKMWHT